MNEDEEKSAHARQGKELAARVTSFIPNLSFIVPGGIVLEAVAGIRSHWNGVILCGRLAMDVGKMNRRVRKERRGRGEKPQKA